MHLLFAITAYLTLNFICMPPILLIFYPYKVFSRCLNYCHRRRWHALHTILLQHFKDAARMELLEDRIFDPCWESIYMLFGFVVVIVNCHILHQISCSWLLHATMVLSLSTLNVQPYKESYMNALLLTLLGFLTLQE